MRRHGAVKLQRAPIEICPGYYLQLQDGELPPFSGYRWRAAYALAFITQHEKPLRRGRRANYLAVYSEPNKLKRCTGVPMLYGRLNLHISRNE